MVVNVEPILTALADVYTPEEARTWLESPQALLDGRTPELAILEGDFALVLGVARGVAEGVFV